MCACVQWGVKDPIYTVWVYEYRCLSAATLSWSVDLLSEEFYFDLFDMYKDEYCQFSCKDKNGSIDFRNKEEKKTLSL